MEIQEREGHRLSELQLLPISALKVDHSLREDGVDARHVEWLTELEGHWHPVLVWGPENLVVDGAHRVAAAQRLGITTIPAQTFDGSIADAVVESIQRNTKHGLPLTLRDRIRAAGRIVRILPDWSDRRIAKVCGLSATTVARVRSETPRAEVPQDTRVGLDGRKRPAHPGATRERVISAIKQNPNGSLRSIAAVACASPETVRTVRKSLHEDRSMSAASTRATTSQPISSINLSPQLSSRPNAIERIKIDSALASCNESDRLLEWLESGSVIDRWTEFVDLIPRGRVYELADEAIRRSEQWATFAHALEARGKPSSAVV